MLTDRVIRTLRAPDAGQRDVSDGADVKGLVIRVSRRAKTFYLVFRRPKDGKPTRIRLGEYPACGLADARAKGREYRAMLDRGVDPREHEKAEATRREAEAADAARKAGNTLANVIIEYVAHCQKAGQRRWRDRERHLRVYVPADWRDRDLANISRGDVRKLLATLEVERGHVMANRVVATLGALYSWAIREGRCEGNPAAGVRSAIPERSRDRVLTDSELVGVWRAAVEIGYPFGSATQLLVLTGQRRNEVSRMRWRDVNLDSASWEIPASEHKMARVHGVPLSGAAVELLLALPRWSNDPSEFVFSPTNGERPITAFWRAKRRLDSISGVTAWRIHDIRRTVASGMARLGVAPHVTEKILGHEAGVIRGVAAIYTRYDFRDEKRDALELWARHMEAIADPSGKVVPLGGRR